MMPTNLDEQAPVPPPAYHRAQARQAGLHIDAVTLVTTLHLLALCRVAVCLAHWRCPPPLPAEPGGTPRRYSEDPDREARERCGDSPIKTCTIGYGPGRPSLKPAACR